MRAFFTEAQQRRAATGFRPAGRNRGRAGEDFGTFADARGTCVVLSMGEKGVNWWRQGGCLHATAAKVAVKSTVGAGDTLLAGMLHGLASGWPDEQVLRTAAALAAHAVSQIGFGIPDSARLQELLQQIHAQTEEGFTL